MIIDKITNDILSIYAEWDNLRILRYRRSPNYFKYVSRKTIQQIRNGTRTVHSFMWRGQAIFLIRISFGGRPDFIGIAHYEVPDGNKDIVSYLLDNNVPIECWNIL
jgi:hypothetical protein